MPNNLSIAEQLAAAYFAISNTMAIESIQVQAAAFGYGRAKMTEGMNLYQTAKQQVGTRKLAFSAQKKATDQTESAFESLSDAYQRVSNVAKGIFQHNDPTQLTALGLDKPKPDTMAEIVAAAEYLFLNITAPEIAAAMTTYGYNEERIAQEVAHLTNYKAAEAMQMQKLADAKKATTTQGEALKTLRRWLQQYFMVMKTALVDDPTAWDALRIRIVEPRPEDPENEVIRDLTDGNDDDDDDEDEVKREDVEDSKI